MAFASIAFLFASSAMLLAMAIFAAVLCSLVTFSNGSTLVIFTFCASYSYCDLRYLIFSDAFYLSTADRPERL